MVNAIPETVQIETYVRGASFDAIKHANEKINRALVGAALSLGANIEIIDIPGYAPLNNDKGLTEIAVEAAKIAIPNHQFYKSDNMSTGSTDMGDLCCVMPVIHPYAGGAVGKSHGNDYYISDPVAACVDNAKWQLTMLRLLLENDGVRAKEIISNYKPMFETKQKYLDFIDTLNDEGDRIAYRDDGTVEARVN